MKVDYYISNFFPCSKKSLTYGATPVSANVPAPKRLCEQQEPSTNFNYESTSRIIDDNEKSLIPFKTSRTGASCIYSPTHHLLSDAASILRRDGLVKGELPLHI